MLFRIEELTPAIYIYATIRGFPLSINEVNDNLSLAFMTLELNGFY